MCFKRCFVALAVLVATAANARAITINTVPVGNVGNGNDPATGYGGVGYAYNIGTTEVTVGQYAAFLNAVAATDTYGLYTEPMATELNVAGIARSGSPGAYTYSTIGSANKPAAYVRWGAAARFCNWLNNGQPTGGQVASTTEDGAYTLNGAISTPDLNDVTRNAGAKWFIPSENEWYKAAYHKNNGPTSDYWSYPTGTNNEPNSDQPPGDPSIQTNVANFYRDDGLANGYNDGAAVTASGCCTSTDNYLTDVGAYTFAISPYGTYDQGGNLREWNESLNNGRGLRGGSWLIRDSVYLQSSRRDSSVDVFSHIVGFRVASVPLVPGDYNNNGIVDAADYVVWRKTLGQSGPDLAADGNNSGTIDSGDYGVWRAHFGNTASGGSGAAANAAVPEPATLFLLTLAMAAGVCSRRRRAA